MRLHYTLLLLVSMQASVATAFTYFESEIDYWRVKPTEGDGKTAKMGKGEKKDKPSSTVSPPFDWKKHTDPKNDEFFREGDYIPPAPFMELVRNPSDENMKNWFQYIGKRNELSQRLSQRMQEYVAQRGSSLDASTRIIAQAQSDEINPSQPDYSRYKFRLYFHSSCPHCKRMMQSMTELGSQGYFVEIVQIDNDRKATQGLPFPVRSADPGELESKGIKSWPVLLVGDLQKKIVYRINGYQPTGKILNSIRGS
ncbi:MAG: TlpA family protein disulfide reductase [Oligoflexales bacterium]